MLLKDPWLVIFFLKLFFFGGAQNVRLQIIL